MHTALQTAGRGAERPLSPSSHTRLGGKTAGAYLGGCWLPWSLSEGYGMIIPTLRGQRASCQCQNRDRPKAVTATLSSRSLPPFPCKKKRAFQPEGNLGQQRDSPSTPWQEGQLPTAWTEGLQAQWLGAWVLRGHRPGTTSQHPRKKGQPGLHSCTSVHE